MAKRRSREGPKIRKRKASKAKASKLHLSIFEEWLRSQPVEPAEAKPEVPMPSGSYEDWIGRQVRKELESGVGGDGS